MSNDHYVAETYLKHFADQREMLHVYSKKRENYFASKPAGVCYERNGDIIAEFLKDPTMLGEYRKIFEPYWNQAISSLPRPNDEDKKAISGYLANILVCTPAWLRAMKKISDANMMHTLKTHDALNTRYGKPDLKLKEILEAIEVGQFAVETKEDFTKALNTSRLLDYAWKIYNSNWLILGNESTALFITSDNPAALEDPGPWIVHKKGFTRYLPLTPKYCLVCDLSEKSTPKTEPDFSRPPQGTIRNAVADARSVKGINKAVVQCAEDFVISSQKLASLEALVKKYARYRVDPHIIEKEIAGEFYFGTTMRVRIPV